ncbi:response regulator [Fulvivirgaceae bacterium BMA12]|uniref:Response regulator n=1 Tax=Agaribacillus aureus TaxID=3051825 RepID=A0ABT8LEY7_9BACT|nr:response regulator [Fulvivirgaceae bacterium BMA12]
MATSCVIIEDQPPAQRILQKYIEDLDMLQLKGTFTDALSVMEFLKSNQVDLIFLDIHLPKLSGIDFLNILSPKPKVILTTAYPDYALQGYELDVVDYLLKPFSFDRFVKAVSKAIYGVSKQIDAPKSAAESGDLSEDFTFVKTGTDYRKIEINAIRFIKSNGDYTELYLVGGKYLVSYSLKYWIDRLNPKWFCQIHKSYLVNVQHIAKVSGNQVYAGEDVLPIGRTYKENFFNNYLEGLV